MHVAWGVEDKAEAIVGSLSANSKVHNSASGEYFRIWVSASTNLVQGVRKGDPLNIWYLSLRFRCG
jgi:hypothetical protein